MPAFAARRRIPPSSLKAIAESTSYDAELAALSSSSASDQDVLEALMVTDVREAADLFRDVFDASNGTDGFWRPDTPRPIESGTPADAVAFDWEDQSSAGSA